MRELKKEQSDNLDRWARILSQPFIELYRGVRYQTLSIYYCLGVGLVAQLILLFRLDRMLLQRLHINLYPTGKGYLIYTVALSFLGFIAWSIRQTVVNQKLLDRLTRVFLNAGFKNAIGRLPSFVHDLPVDDFSRKLRVSNAGFALSKFKSAKESLEAGLQIYIDDIKEDREKGIVDVIYAFDPMPKYTVIENIMALKGYKFVIGRTRAKQVTTSLLDHPHLMIAGQTGGGKSTAIRQIITSLYVNQPQTRFVLVDLKGGLEFQIFENIRGIQVAGTVKDASDQLAHVDELLDKRMATIKNAGCKDIDQFILRHKRNVFESNSSSLPLNRIVVVIDEAAEMFLVQESRDSEKIQDAKRTLSRIARLGRAVGVHLIVATQRPDKQALDTQIKANLTGALCFQMQNDASSIAVLGNGRATDLPDIPGRAIWKTGTSMTEIQTPMMTPSEAEEILKTFKVTVEKIPQETIDA